MFLVAGLAVAGVAGILAAIYFGVRSGKLGGKRRRPAAQGRIGADRAAASRPGAVRRPGGRAALVRSGGPTEFDLRASGPRPAAGPGGQAAGPGGQAAGTGRQAAGSRPPRAQAGALTESWPAAPSDLDDPQSGAAWPGGEWPGDPTAADPGLRAARPSASRGSADRGSADRGSADWDTADRDRTGFGTPDPGASKDSRARRRVGFRKGADIDEELWPAESFGGVSDEQFWNDLASDKPLTTTARTAQQEAGPRSRLLDTGSDTDPQGTQALGTEPGQGRTSPSRTSQSRTSPGRADRARADQPRPDQGPAGRTPGEGRRPAGYGAYPGNRTADPRTGDPRTAGPRTAGPRTAGPDPAADRTQVQPAYAATQPVKSMTPPPAQAPPKPFPGATQPAKKATPPPAAPQPVRAAAAGTGPSSTGPFSTVGPPRGASGQPGQPGDTARRRRPSSTEEDPLTSSSFSLRQRGPVDGRSSFRSRDGQDAPRDRDVASGSGRGAASPYGHAAPYPPAGTSYDDASSATQMMSTPAYGENRGYGGSQPDHPRHRNGARSHARPGGGTGERPRPSRPAYPEDVRQASGSYPAGAYPGNNGHGHQPAGYPGGGQPDASRPGSGYPSGSYQGPGGGSRGNGHRAPHDPNDDYRRLTHRRLPSRLGSCPRETWSGRPPAACTRRWRDAR